MEDVWKRAHLDHLSAAQLLRTPAKWIFDYVYLSPAERIAQGVGWRAHMGSAVHDAVQAICIAGQDIDEAVAVALNEYDTCMAEDDQVLRQRMRDAIPGCVDHGVEAVSGAGFVAGKSEQFAKLELPGIAVPVIGYIDFQQTLANGALINCELKTKGPRKTRLLKDGSQGWSKATLPKRPEWKNVCQASIYSAATGAETVIIYAAEHDSITFTAENCDELKPSGLAVALEEMRQRALIRQNLLKISADPRVLASITDPDWQHMYQWKIGEEFLWKAKELWKQ